PLLPHNSIPIFLQAHPPVPPPPPIHAPHYCPTPRRPHHPRHPRPHHPTPHDSHSVNRHFFLVHDFAAQSAIWPARNRVSRMRECNRNSVASCSGPRQSSRFPALRRCTPSPAHTAIHFAATHSKS